MRIFRYLSIVTLVTIGSVYLSGCKTNERRLNEEARAEATKLWESQVFRKCGGEFADYFGKRERKIYQFHGQYVVAAKVKEGPGDIPGVFEMVRSDDHRVLSVAHVRERRMDWMAGRQNSVAGLNI